MTGNDAVEKHNPYRENNVAKKERKTYISSNIPKI